MSLSPSVYARDPRAQNTQLFLALTESTSIIKITNSRGLLFDTEHSSRLFPMKFPRAYSRGPQPVRKRFASSSIHSRKSLLLQTHLVSRNRHLDRYHLYTDHGFQYTRLRMIAAVAILGVFPAIIQTRHKSDNNPVRRLNRTEFTRISLLVILE